MSLYAFLLTSVIIILLPGTGVIYTISTGITKGRMLSVIAAIGCTAGIIPHLCISIVLSTFVLNLNEEAFNIVKILGVFYLLYLGVGMIVRSRRLDFESKKVTDKPSHIIRRGILINLLNPKLTIFFFSFLPQYVGGSSKNYVRESVTLGVFFMFLTFLVFSIYGVMASTMKNVVMKSEKRQKRVQQLFGVVFIIFSAELLFG